MIKGYQQNAVWPAHDCKPMGTGGCPVCGAIIIPTERPAVSEQQLSDNLALALWKHNVLNPAVAKLKAEGKWPEPQIVSQPPTPDRGIAEPPFLETADLDKNSYEWWNGPGDRTEDARFGYRAGYIAGYESIADRLRSVETPDAEIKRWFQQFYPNVPFRDPNQALQLICHELWAKRNETPNLDITAEEGDQIRIILEAVRYKLCLACGNWPGETTNSCGSCDALAKAFVSLDGVTMPRLIAVIQNLAKS